MRETSREKIQILRKVQQIQMLIPNAQSCKHATLKTRQIYGWLLSKLIRVCYRLSCRLLGVLHADFQSVSYLTDFSGSVSHHSLHYRCVLNMPADINKARSKRQKKILAEMNVRHDGKIAMQIIDSTT